MIRKTFDMISTKRKSISLPIIALCWVCFAWGTTWIASKHGVKNMPALQMAAIRQFIAGACYILYFILYKKTAFPKWKQWKTIFVLAILNFTFSNGLSTWGVKYISSGLGAIIGSVFPIWIVIISMIRGEKVVRLALFGMFICFCGICVIFRDYLEDLLNPTFLFGIFVSLIATITWALGQIYTREKAASFNPYFSIGLQMFVSSILLFAFTGATGTSISIAEIPATSWFAIIYLVIFGSIISFIALLYAFQHLSSEIISIYAYINPIVAVLLGIIFFDEHLTTALVTGISITIVGLYFINFGLKKSRR